MIFLPVQFVNRSTRSLPGFKIRGLLQGQREGALRCTREPMTCPTRTLCMLWKMWLLWLFQVMILNVLVSTNNGKQIFFDTFLDTPLLRKNVIWTKVVIRIFDSVTTATLLRCALGRNWQPYWDTTALWRGTCTPMAQWNWVMFLTIADHMWTQLNNFDLEDILQL